jgi:hypothetical protein
MNLPRSVRLVALCALLLATAGCKSAYYNTWEKLGWAKRDILVDRVKDARDDQEEAKKQFKTTLERFQELTNFQGGDLEAMYKKLNGEYEDSVGAAEDVSKRIKAVESVANDMFKEWQDELKQFSNAELRRSSEEKLRDTRQRYNQLIGVMKQAEAKMKPVLAVFKDHVLSLKHNLNAQAVSSLQDTAAKIQSDVGNLIADMERSIAEANAFINQMNKAGG